MRPSIVSAIQTGPPACVTPVDGDLQFGVEQIKKEVLIEWALECAAHFKIIRAIFGGAHRTGSRVIPSAQH